MTGYPTRGRLVHLEVPPNTRVEPTGWIEAILAARSDKKVVPIYRCAPSSRRLTRRPLGGAQGETFVEFRTIVRLDTEFILLEIGIQ
jgi:hypothetical protein